MLHHMVGALGFPLAEILQREGPSFFPCANARRPFPILEDLGRAMPPLLGLLGV